jgi:two-component system chemotaxis sensor kinase CheA
LLAELTAAQAANAGGTAAPAPQPKAKPAKAPRQARPEPAAEAQDAPNADLDIDLDAMLDDLAGAMGGSSPEAEARTMMPRALKCASGLMPARCATAANRC